jgi:hypothetical protein
MTFFLSEHSTSVQKVSDIICEIIQENKKAKVDDRIPGPFSSKIKTTIKIPEYIMRIVKYAKIEESTLIVALIYIDRICDFNNFLLTENNIHRVVLLSIISAIKYNEDDIYTNTFYAKVGGLTREELHRLEIEYLNMIRYKLFVDNKVYLQYRAYLKQYKQERYMR